MRGRIANLLVTAIGSVAAGAAGASASGWEQRVEPMAVATPGAAADRRADRGPAFTVPAGFTVERLFAVPRDELGSWVCLTVDPQGRILASDQGEKGLARITPAPLDGSAATRVERIEVPMTAAQGLLCAFGAVYAVRNDGAGSGLYRITDVDTDDRWDTVEKLHAFAGGGEHGPHAIQLSPDGGRLFVVCGNHTKLPLAVDDLTPPQEMGGIRTTQRRTVLRAGGRSRLPANWDEDQIIPRLWDPGGHAVGILAPGGYVVSVDPDGGDVELWSAGYRNAYDMAFNADGELFAYDSDMEWDYGTPWYRPTRINHATSGSDLGWRSGSGKLPAVFPDTVPPVVEVGPGSPVGVTFGYGAAFPAAYQRALFACDWTFGTIYAIHIEPSGSSYTAVKEEFVSRTPLPLTDVATGPDGALYFSVGGRGTQSELFRVTYSGPESTVPAELKDARQAGLRSSRRSLENWHAGRSGGDLQPSADSATFIQTLQSMGQGGDRFLRAASRNAFYHSQLFADLMQPQNVAEMDLSAFEPGDRLYVLLALIRAPFTQLTKSRGLTETQIVELEDAVRAMSIRQLQGLDFASLNRDQKLDYLRVLSLLFLRLGPPENETRAAFISRLDAQFPSSDAELNRELCQVLIYLRSPTIVGKTVALLEAESKATVTDDMQDLLARNRGYGGAIAASIASAPDQQQIAYAFSLRNAVEGWTIDSRKAFFAWFERARRWSGGASFQGFLRNIENETFLNASERDRLLIEASGARKPYAPPELPKPTGPGKEWTLDEVRALADSGLKGRNFENGQKMFAATRCIICHRFGGEGGATGPDLTQLAGRFNVRDLTEAIIEPSKVISDQYRGSTVVTKDGLSVSGRVIAETGTSVTVLTNPEDPTKITEIAKSDVEELQPSSVSIMPADLLKPLNQDEVLDLLAYLLSRGEKNNPMFRR